MKKIPRRRHKPLRLFVPFKKIRIHKIHTRGLRIQKSFVSAAMALCVIIASFIIFSSLIGKSYSKAKISAEDVSRFRISYSALTTLYDLSQKYSINFSELLSIYSIDNKFFPPGSGSVPSADEIEKKYILSYDQMKAKYPEEDYKVYYKIIKDTFSNISAFPVSSEFKIDDYMYGNSFGSLEHYGVKSESRGIDIIDRENISGRVGVISMTSGSVVSAGWNEKNGYYVSINSIDGVNYTYGSLSASEFKEGDPIAAGQLLGYMSGSAYSKKKGGDSAYPICLNIEIKPNTELGSNNLYFNPYPVLRFLEYRGKIEKKASY